MVLLDTPRRKNSFSDNFGHSNCVILRESCKVDDLHFHSQRAVSRIFVSEMCSSVKFRKWVRIPLGSLSSQNTDGLGMHNIFAWISLIAAHVQPCYLKSFLVSKPGNEKGEIRVDGSVGESSGLRWSHAARKPERKKNQQGHRGAVDGAE